MHNHLNTVTLPPASVGWHVVWHAHPSRWLRSASHHARRQQTASLLSLDTAGEPIATRWTAAHKAEIKRSRVAATRAVVDAVNALPAAQRPRVLVSTSAIGEIVVRHVRFGSTLLCPDLIQVVHRAGGAWLVSLCLPAGQCLLRWPRLDDVLERSRADPACHWTTVAATASVIQQLHCTPLFVCLGSRSSMSSYTLYDPPSPLQATTAPATASRSARPAGRGATTWRRCAASGRTSQILQR